MGIACDSFWSSKTDSFCRSPLGVRGPPRVSGAWDTSESMPEPYETYWHINRIDGEYLWGDASVLYEPIVLDHGEEEPYSIGGDGRVAWVQANDTIETYAPLVLVEYDAKTLTQVRWWWHPSNTTETWTGGKATSKIVTAERLPGDENYDDIYVSAYTIIDGSLVLIRQWTRETPTYIRGAGGDGENYTWAWTKHNPGSDEVTIYQWDGFGSLMLRHTLTPENFPDEHMWFPWRMLRDCGGSENSFIGLVGTWVGIDHVRYRFDKVGDRLVLHRKYVVAWHATNYHWGCGGRGQ